MKKASVCLIAALVLVFAFALTGCGRQDNPSPAPSTTPSVTPTPSAAPSVLPEIMDDMTPDADDGIVKDEDGVITEGDTGSTDKKPVDANDKVGANGGTTANSSTTGSGK